MTPWIRDNFLLGLLELFLTAMITPILLGVSCMLKLFSLVRHRLFLRGNTSHQPLADAEKIAIVITGASAGLGRALAIEYAKAYPRAQRLCFGLIGTNEQRLQETCTILCESFENVKQEDVQIGVIDVRDARAMREFIHAFEHKFDGINVLIANAGVTEFTLREHNPDLTFAQMQRQVSDINYNGVLNTVLPMVERLEEEDVAHGGTGMYRNGDQHLYICIVSSMAARVPMASVYGVTKRAVVEYSRYLRKYFSSYSNVHISSVLPGWMDTGMARVFPGSTPFMLSTEQSAHIIRTGMERGDGMIIFPMVIYLGVLLVEMLPFGLLEPIFNLTPRPQT